MVDLIGKKAPELRVARVAIAAGLFPYLRKAQTKELFSEYLERMKQVGSHWTKNPQHGELLRNLSEIGGLNNVPEELLVEYLEWLVSCYIGEPGGYGAGYSRKVFYSNVGGPLALDILKASDRPIAKFITTLAKTAPKIKAAIADEHVSRRFESILDTVKN